MGAHFALAPAMVIGRCLAYCVHPAAAWLRLPRRGRVLLLTAYFGAGYMLTLTALLII
jgi:hypothetical protein